jgi:hypothetical protein
LPRFDRQADHLLAAQAVLLKRHVACGWCNVSCVKVSSINEMVITTKILLNLVAACLVFVMRGFVSLV